MSDFFEQLKRLSPERRALLERKLSEKGLQTALPNQIPQRSKNDDAPLSFAQQRLWFVQQLDAESTAYNVATVLRLSGALNVSAMSKSLQELVQRHQGLRSRFIAGAIASQPQQCVEATPKDLLPLTDLRGQDNPQKVANNLIDQLIGKAFDLTQVPLRTALLQTSDTEYLLVLATHHIVCDRWSVGVFLRELATLYTAQLQGKSSPLTPLPIQYADYALWQKQTLQGAELERLNNYWSQKLGGDLPLLELPYDGARSKEASDIGAQLPIQLSLKLTKQLNELALKHKTTLFTLLLSAFKVLLHRYTDSSDIVVGTDIANRDRPETESLIGLLVNTLVLRSGLEGNPSFIKLMQQVKKTVLDALSHQALPFEKLVELLNPERHLDQLMPLFQAKFDLQLARVQAMELDGLTLSRETPADERTKYELRFNLQDGETGINGQIEYCSELFNTTTVAAMARHYQCLLESLVENPETSIQKLAMVNVEERRQLLFTHNQTQTHYPEVESLAALFEKQVSKTPSAIALKWGSQYLSYQQLNQHANRLAWQLVETGVAAETPVGICMPRTPKLLIALLATLKAGACYIPLDPAYPVERLRLIAEDANMAILLVDNDDKNSQGSFVSETPLRNDEFLQCIPVTYASDFHSDVHNYPLDHKLDNNLDISISSHQLAYVIYTSGSTGRPKGVAIEHRNTLAMLQWAQEEFSSTDLENTVATTSICFDLSVFELFLPLSCGASVVLMDNALALAKLDESREISLLNTVPSVLTRLLNNYALPKSLRVVNLAGEALPPQLIRRLQQLGHVKKVYNLYGPSEDTTYSTWALFDLDKPLPAMHHAPIGLPISNTQAYVLDQHQQPVADGIVGELYLGGDGLARGYLGQAELSANVFINNPFAAEGAPSSRLYRTGDRVKRLSNGVLEFLGRKDDQVKIRGYRIETGEVDNALHQHPGIKEALVLAQDIYVGNSVSNSSNDGSSTDLQLVAYIEAKPTLEIKTLKPYLQQRLPNHLVPTHIKVLGDMPRLPNGKINRKVLATLFNNTDASALTDNSFVEPSTLLEQELVNIWATVLNCKRVGVHDDFFELGGHSLLAIDIIAQCQKQGYHLPLRSLFQAPTVAQLATIIEVQDKRLTPDAEGIENTRLPILQSDSENAHKPFPLTDIQQAYLLGRNAAFELGNISTHGYREIEISNIKLNDIEQALNNIIQRHPMLRAIITSEQQQQVLANVPHYSVKKHKLNKLDKDQREAQLLDSRQRLSHQVFNPQQWPLFGVEASVIEESRIRIHLSFDVLIGDAWSFQLLGREMAMQLLNIPLPKLDLHFRDYVLAEQEFEKSETYQASLSYWEKRIPDLPPAPELPLSKAPSEVKTPHFVRRSGQLAAPLWQRIQQRAQKQSLTPSAFILTVFSETLSSFCRRSHFTLNLTLFNRQPVHSDINAIVGDFTASLLLAIRYKGEDSLVANARVLQDQLWQDLDHRAVSGVRLQRDLAKVQNRSGGAIMPVVFTSTLNQQTQASGPTQWQSEIVHGVSQTSQVYMDHQVSEVNGALHFNWDTIDELFPSGLLDQLCECYQQRLLALASEQNNWDDIWQQPLPDNQFGDWLPSYNTQQQQNQTVTNNARLERLFFAAVKKHPNNIAVIGHDRELSYQKLADEVQKLTQQLQKMQVKANELVAVSMEKGWQQIVATLAVMTAGAAYVPIDPELPKVRRHELLKDTQANILLCTDLDNDWPSTVQQVEIIESTDKIEQVNIEDVQLSKSTRDLAYVIYTSGSTGIPKGVMIDHRGAVNTIVDINQRHKVHSSDVVLGLSSLSFDLSVYDIFGTLAVGATLVLPNPKRLQQPDHWLTLVQQHKVSIWNSVPALMQLLVESSESSSCTQSVLRKVLLSGDWIPLTLPSAICKQFPNAEIISMGGATEASIWSIDYPITEIDPNWRSIPYGQPLANQQWYILDKHMRPRPPWVPGSLYIGGIGLGCGYWQQPDLSAQHFVPNPLSDEMAGLKNTGNHAQPTLYRTGDLGCYRPDGTIEFLGREDHQVKVNGYRIELGEIEAVLQQHSGIAAAAVAMHGNPPSLSAYVVPAKTINKLDFKQAQNGWSTANKSDGKAVDLPTVKVPDTLLKRQSHRRFLQQSISLTDFAQWLSALRAWPVSDAPIPKYRYPSAGNSYPLQAFIQVQPKRIDGLDSGWYYYHPAEHQLKPLHLNNEAQVPINVDYGINQAAFEQAGFSVFLVAQMNAITPLYGNKARDMALLEAGYASQLLMECAPQQNLGLCPIGGKSLKQIQDLLQLNEQSEVLHGLLGGAIDPEWSNQWQAMSSQGSSSMNNLQQWMRDRLPAYMVPSRIQPINALPLTGNGKLDRNALPEPIITASAYVAPSSSTEQKIVELWKSLIKVERIGLHDDFFALGGSSIVAMQLIVKLRESFSIELSLGQLYGALTPAEQATLIDTVIKRQSSNSTSASSDINTRSPQAASSIQALQRDTNISVGEHSVKQSIDNMADHDVDDMLAQLLAQQDLES